jgi:micrococcal nuclease
MRSVPAFVMRRPTRYAYALLAALTILVAWVTGAAAQEAITAYVTRIVDGDTIYVAIGNRLEPVRYIGINTPEVHHPRLGRQPGGEAASEANRQLVEGRWVTLVFDVQQSDRHGRLLAYVWVGDRFVNGELVHRGYAQAATFPPNVRYAEYFRELERGARAGQRGLWGNPAAEPTMRQHPKWAREHAIQFKAPASESGSVETFSAPAPSGMPYHDAQRRRDQHVNGYWRSNPDGGRTWVDEYQRSRAGQ